MEGFRGLAVALVFFVHYHALFSVWSLEGSATFQISRMLNHIGHSGVDLFFLLSGYLIYGTVISKRTNYPTFMKRRVQRIYPTFLCVLAIYLGLSLVLPSEQRMPKGFVDASVYLLQNVLLLPGIFDIRAVITVAWSLSYEMFFYLVIPLIVTGLAMRKWPAQRRAIFFLAIVAALTGICMVTSFSHFRMIMFISGILLYEAIHSFKIGERTNTTFDVSVLLWSLAILPAIHLLSGRDLLLTPDAGRGWRMARQVMLFVSFFLLALSCFTSRGLMMRLFSWAPLRWLGNMSYSYYLIHGLALKGVQMVVRRIIPITDAPAVFWIVLPMAFLVTLIISTLLFVLVEKRFSLVPRLRPVANPLAAKVGAPSGSV